MFECQSKQEEPLHADATLLSQTLGTIPNVDQELSFLC